MYRASLREIGTPSELLPKSRFYLRYSTYLPSNGSWSTCTTPRIIIIEYYKTHELEKGKQVSEYITLSNVHVS